MTLFLFDLDGTLTPPRLKMTKEFEDFFVSWAKNKKCFIVTGSDFKKVTEQLSLEVMNVFEGIYCSMGNVLWQKGRFVYKNEFKADEKLLKMLENYRASTSYPYQLFDNYIEKRDGMINFSVLGRDCPYEERIKYFEFDKEHCERKKIKNELSETFKEYDISIGGMISMDITPKGYGKEQVAEKLRAKFPAEKIIFFGDKTFEGGNDYTLAQAVLKSGNSSVVQVSGPDVTKEFLLTNGD